MKPILPILSSVLALALSACRPDPPAAAATDEEHGPPPVTEVLEPYECGNVTRLHTLGGVFLASQPDAADFEQASLGGVRSVINLRHDAEQPDFDERSVVEGLGLAYVHLPFNGPDELTDEVFDEALRLLDALERPILLHCKSANRVGALWLPYRVLAGDLTVEQAQAEAATVGLKSPAYERKALDYIERKSR